MGHAGIDDLEPGEHSRRARRRRARAATRAPTTITAPEPDGEQRQIPKDVEHSAATATSFSSGPRILERQPYLWTSAMGDYENDDFRFSDFQPCYIACIRDLELQIKQKIRGIDVASAERDEKLTRELEMLLTRYSQLIDALDSIEHNDRVFEEDGMLSDKNDIVTRFSGERRRISRPQEDHDHVHAALQQNLILLTLGYIYNWDAANSVKRRFGNVTKTLDRVLIGLAGGAMLLVPMIIMVYVRGRVARLVIVSLATLLFAIGLSFMNDIKRDGVVAATAAYAAVMVVFIGSSEDSATTG